MTRILFAWELGTGFGHIMPYRDLIGQLTARGTEVSFAARDLANTEQVLGGPGVRFFQAPALYGRAKYARMPGDSYIDVLHNAGFSDPFHLKGRIKAWREIFDVVKPDIVICDGAPAANLVARRFGCARITSGTGFFVPPAVSPPPLLRFWIPNTDVPIAEHEHELLDSMNASLEAVGEAPIGFVHELVEADDHFLMNFAETDHYPARSDADYLGTFPARRYGVDHEWPAIDGKRVFGYLSPFKTLPALLEAMKQFGVSATIYAPEVRQKTRRAYHGERIRFVDEPAHLPHVLRDCDVALTNGNLASSASILLAGKPLLMLPTTLEKQIVARRIQDLGAGLSAPQLKPRGMASKLHALLNDDRYAQQARGFRHRYGDLGKEWQLERMLAKIDRLLGRAAV